MRPMVYPSGIYTMGNEYVTPPGLGFFFNVIPRLIPTGIYTAGYEYNSLPGMRILLLNVNMGSFDAYLQSASREYC